MEFSHVFYKEIPLDEDNIFLASLTKNNEDEQIKLKKSKLYVTSGLSIDQDLKPYISLPNIEGRKALNVISRVYTEEKKSFNLDLKIKKVGYFAIIVKKKTD